MNLNLTHLLYGNPSKGLSEKDYYPFGMVMPERNFTSDNYRFGFNGKERDDEVKGIGAQYDYGFRIYDTRLAKFLSVDPLFKSYPWYSPYQFSGNSPILNVDLDGLEEENYLLYLLKLYLGIGPKPHSATEASKQAQEKNSSQEVLNHMEKMGEAYEMVYGSIVPFYSAMFAYGKGYYIRATFYTSIDLFGSKIIGKVGDETLGFFKSLIIEGEFGKYAREAGVTSVKIVEGTSEKTAIIGQGVDRINAIKEGVKNAEVFTPSEGAELQWQKLLVDYSGMQIPDDVVKGTKIFKENQQWVNNVKKGGYNIMDIGADGTGRKSTFYEMESQTVYDTGNNK